MTIHTWIDNDWILCCPLLFYMPRLIALGHSPNFPCIWVLPCLANFLIDALCFNLLIICINIYVKYLIGLLQVRASLFAAGCFCETSDDFACITVEMLFNMMNSSEVSFPVKMAAAQVFTKFNCPFFQLQIKPTRWLTILSFCDI